MPNAFWCPVNPTSDQALKTACSTATSLPGVDTVSYGTTLQGLGNDDTLYLLAHGHSQMPLFTVSGGGKWTASQMVDRLVGAKLNKGHQQIVMLVCHAGQSLGDQSVIDKRLKLSSQINSVVNHKALPFRTEARQRITEKFNELKRQASPTQFTSESQVLPLICQFIDELKSRGYRRIRVRGYLNEVMAHFEKGIKVKGRTGWEAASDSNTVDWL